MFFFQILFFIGGRIVKNFIDFIVDLIPTKNEKLQIMYGIDGQKILTEKALDHLSGYKNSKPVRVGNAAYSQKQNDIYGILMDAIHFQIEKYKEPPVFNNIKVYFFFVFSYFYWHFWY